MAHLESDALRATRYGQSAQDQKIPRFPEISCQSTLNDPAAAGKPTDSSRPSGIPVEMIRKRGPRRDTRRSHSRNFPYHVSPCRRPFLLAGNILGEFEGATPPHSKPNAWRAWRACDPPGHAASMLRRAPCRARPGESRAGAPGIASRVTGVSGPPAWLAPDRACPPKAAGVRPCLHFRHRNARKSPARPANRQRNKYVSITYAFSAWQH